MLYRRRREQRGSTYRVAAAGPDEVLVAARQHEIDIIERGIEDEQELTGIGYMKIGLDFIVAETTAA